MPDQNEINEYKKKISTLSLTDLKDILAHINKDKVPWKYDLVKAEIEAKETGVPVKPVEQKAETVKEPPPPPKPAFQIRKAKIGAEAPAEEKKAEAVKPVEERPAVKPEPEALKPAAEEAPAPKKAEPAGIPVAAASPVDYAFLGASIVFLILAVYIAAVPFVNLPGSAAVKALLNKIPIF